MTEFSRLSYSAIRSWLECARSFEYRYIKKTPAILKGRLVGGRVYHKGIAYALKRKMAGALATAEEVKDIISDRWDAELSERVVYDELDEPKVEARQVEWGEDKPSELKDTVMKLAGIYLAKILPKLEPIAVEQRLEGEIDGIPFVGYPDALITPGNGIIDHKFAKRRMSQSDADKDIQLSSYAALLQKPIYGAFHQALDQKTLDINIVLTERGQSDIDWFTKLAVTVWQCIQSGLFPPNPLGWKCSEATCDYYVECKILMEY